MEESGSIIGANFLLTFVVVIAILIGLYFYWRSRQKKINRTTKR